MLNICKKIFSQLVSQKVSYCHWKSNEHLMEGLNGETDLDLLVSELHRKRFFDVLIQCECIKVQPQYGSRYPKVEEWIGYDRETGRLIHLHVHFRIITGTKHIKEYILPWHDLALETRVLDDSGTVYIVEPHLELIILYARIVLKLSRQVDKTDKFVLPAEYRKEILWLRQQIDTERLSKLIGVIWEKEQKEVLAIVQRKRMTKDDFVKLQKLVIDKVEVVKRGKIFNNAKTAIVRNRLVDIKNLLKDKYDIVPFTALKTLYGRGCVFAFIGCDGSGKSSMTKEICKWLSWKLDCQRFYLGTGDGYKKPIIYKISMVTWLPDAVQKMCKILFYYQVSLRCVCMRRLIDFYVSRGGIAICDRYPQTQFKGIYDGPKIRALGLGEDNALWNVISRAEEQNIAKVENKDIGLVFKLLLPTKIALRRSPGHAADEVKRKAWITEKLQFAASDVYEVDATQPFDKELLEIKGIIWDKLIENQL